MSDSNFSKEVFREADTDTSIRFLLHTEARELTDFDPCQTVLEYLRNTEQMTGTKEGCAEGDCGACTVVLVEHVKGKLHYKAVNSCIMLLPHLHGKQLITVEHLRHPNGRLHPVQQALVDQHGSQCGFCTPGFVMSLFSMYHNRCRTDRRTIDDELAGNLCRCTGYAPIVKAAQQVLSSIVPDQFDDRESATMQSIKDLDTSRMVRVLKNDEQFFLAPKTVREFEACIAAYPDYHVVSGATDVGLWITKDQKKLRPLAYIGLLNSLKKIRNTNGHLQIGAGVALNDAMKRLVPLYPTLRDLLIRFGSVQIRNLATVGGNIANGSPIGDLPPAFIALDAEIVLQGQNTVRTLQLENFFIDYGIQDLKPGEYVSRINVPVHSSKDSVFKVYKLSKRYHQDISAVCGAFFCHKSRGRIKGMRICFGGMAATPSRAYNCERFLENKRITELDVEQACTALKNDYTPITDFRGTADYRLLAAQNLLRKFFLEVKSKSQLDIRED